MKQLYRQRIRDCLKQADRSYGSVLKVPSEYEILFNQEYFQTQFIAKTSFDLNRKVGENIISLNLRNKNMIEDDEFICDEILPHELSHAICFKNMINEHDHGDVWKTLCVEMGGSGAPVYFK